MQVKISCISTESCIQFIQMDKNSKSFMHYHAFINASCSHSPMEI